MQKQQLPILSWFRLATQHVNNRSLQWTVLLGHPAVSKMLAAMKRIAAEIILFFYEKSTSLHCAYNTVQLLKQKTRLIVSQLHGPIDPVLNPKISRFILQHVCIYTVSYTHLTLPTIYSV